MPPSRSEFLEHQAMVMNIPKASIDTALGMIKTAAVSFENLTNDPHWDRFLSYVQGMYEEAKTLQEVAAHAAACQSGEAETRYYQNSYHAERAKVEVLTKILALPTQLREQYKGLQEG